MLNLPQVRKDGGVSVIGISKASQIALAMASFIPDNKESQAIVMNSTFSYFMEDIIYKGKKVLSGKHLKHTDECRKQNLNT